ncbi:Sec20-domain-containing protein [Hypoxylon trugodes]|uniref:Sec20-domain-containing protein n=1 Tax=Hypoxylon trugodes TaxID=326681 RepID=UPI00219A36E5|nr:Sec20-domain-containing protein [Hypoxylon trugodes]KAI1386975.1 Sec20-domain-containing protein [Hypoxylon trugodes]
MSHEALEKRFTELQDRLAVLQDATNQLKELIDRLANFDFQPGSVPLGASEDDNVGAELSTEINQVLREQEEELELLREEIVDVRPGKNGSGSQHDKERLKEGANRLELELQNCRKAFRRAQITAKHNLQQAQRQERELLYASFSNPRSGASSPLPTDPTTTNSTTTAANLLTRRKPRPQQTKEEQLISASSDVTDSLRRTHDLMASELAKSDFAHNALRESTAALSQLSDTYGSLDAMLASSRALLTTLLKSQKTDTWYLQSAFYLLLGTVCWLVFRRLLWGPTWWLVWLPLKLVFRTAVVVTGVAKRGSQGLGTTEGAVTATMPQAQMNNEGVHTAQVSFASQVPQESSESVMGEVERITNETGEEQSTGGNDTQGEQEGETVLRERREDEPRNPKKRIMEEDPNPRQEGSNERVKDEL